MEESTSTGGKTPRKASPKPPTTKAPRPAKAKPAQDSTARATASTHPPVSEATPAKTFPATPRKPVAAQASPAESKPGAAKPIKAKPAQAKPVPAKPVQARSAEAGKNTPKKTSAATATVSRRAARHAVPDERLGSRQPRPEPVMEQLEIALPGGAVRDAQVPTEPTQRAAGVDEPTMPGAHRTIPLWARLVADPGFAPEHIARAAVRDLGPAAQDWAERMRLRYPRATPAALARLAAHELGQDARRSGTATAAGGVVGSVATTAVLARGQARMVLAIAAAYGSDPSAEARVRDLLTLLRVPRMTEPARAALTNVARIIAAVTLQRAAARAIPFGAALVGVVHSGRSTADLANRAIELYRNPNRP